MDTNNLWKHTWPSSEILCEFIASNSKLWKGSTILELGAGVAALPSLTCLKCGAAKAFLTDQKHLSNSLDWNDKQSIENFLNKTEELDFIFGSDIFFDPQVFSIIILLICRLFNRFPRAEFYFAYQIRDSDWSIEDFIIINRLICLPIRLVNTEKHSIYLGKIISLNVSLNLKLEMAQKIQLFAGIEGGATRSTLFLIDSTGQKFGPWIETGLNCLLKGIEATADFICEWIRFIVREQSIKNLNFTFNLPLYGLGMGLAGAENVETNDKMIEYLKKNHSDISQNFFLTADSVISIASCFDKGGVSLIAGTGSACRLLTANGTMHSVGGWGHLIGDGGSGFWISMKAIRSIFDIYDGTEKSEFNIKTIELALLSHFKITNRLQIFEIIYGDRFDKANVASFCATLSNSNFL